MTPLKAVGFVVAGKIGDGRSGEPNGGRQEKNLGDNSIPSSGNYSNGGASPKCQPGTSFPFLLISKF